LLTVQSNVNWLRSFWPEVRQSVKAWWVRVPGRGDAVEGARDKIYPLKTHSQ
jgi:hypothetical protein